MLKVFKDRENSVTMLLSNIALSLDVEGHVTIALNQLE